MDSLLPLLILIPLVGALVTLFVPEAFARFWAVGTSVVTLILVLLFSSAAFVVEGEATYGQLFRDVFRTGANVPAVEGLKVFLAFGMNPVSYWLCLLTAALMPLALLASFGSITTREKAYYGWMLVLLSIMLGVFIARDLLLFYVFFELTLVPMFFIIGIWGGPERRYAAAKFFLYTFAGGVFTLAGVVYLGLRANGFLLDNVASWSQVSLTETTRVVVFLCLLAGFAVKVPLFPVHTWLPLAHTEAPTAGSVILAGVLLKLGTYGLFAVVVPLALISSTGVDVAMQWFIKALAVLCIIGVIYGALIAWVQQDIKKLVAYSSVSHLGFCVLGLIALNTTGLQGSVMYMINHGISTGAMFLVIGMIYDRYHTRDINALSGLAKRMPIMAFFFVLFVMSSIGLPGTNGFVSEFLTILGAFTSDYLGPWYGIVAATGVVLGAIYMLHMTARVVMGPLRAPDPDHHHGVAVTAFGATATGSQADEGQTGPASDAHGDPHGRGGVHAPGHVPGDLTGREIFVLTPLAIAVIVLGVVPTPVLHSILPTIEAIRTPLPVPTEPAMAGDLPAHDQSAEASLAASR